VTDFSDALSDLGEVVLDVGFRLCRDRRSASEGEPTLPPGNTCPVALLGLGKLGGRELGYASDLELLVVYEGAGPTAKTGLENGAFFEAVVQDLTGAIEAREEGIFHLDLRLRPHGKKGPLASPFALIQDYYRPGGAAHSLERQALLKLRFIGGDEGLGRKVEAVRDRYVWSGEPWDRAAALHLRERQVTELVPPGRFNVKLSRGALVDVEYAAQYLQIQHGQRHPALRTPRTLDALDRLLALGFLSASDHHILREGYLFWRRVTDALRMVRGHASDLLLPDEGGEELRLLARRLGYSGSDWSRAAAALDADVDRHRLGIRAVFDLLVARSESSAR
jgi:glutamate-ammonia-ligase adenylyltransferase